MASEFSTVVGAGKGWTRVRTADGQEYTLRGARNWRNNNPGNIEYGPFARSMGAIGSDGRFAVFPSYDAGRAAKSSLLFNSPKYNTKTIAGAIEKYAPPNENNTKSYVSRVARALGLSSDTPISSLDPQQQSTMMDAMQRVEGFRVGRAFDGQGNIIDPSALQVNQNGGIMQAVNNVPVPQARPDFNQAQQTTGIMSAVNPITPSLVERQALPAVSNGLLSTASAQMSQPMKGARAAATFSQPQVSLDTLRQQEPAQQGLLGAASAMRPTGADASGVANFAQPDAAGLLSADVAYQRMIDGLNAQKKQLAAGVNPMADLPSWQQPAQQPVQQPMAQPQEIQPSYEQTASVAGPAGVGGLLSAQEQQMLDAQRASLSQQPFNRNLGPRMGNFAKGALGGVGGGILGSLVGGPIGGLLGSLVGKSLMNGKLNTQITGYPQAPKSKSQGDGKETDYGRSVRESSRQYDKAVKSGSVGLY